MTIVPRPILPPPPLGMGSRMPPPPSPPPLRVSIWLWSIRAFGLKRIACGPFAPMGPRRLGVARSAVPRRDAAP